LVKQRRFIDARKIFCLDSGVIATEETRLRPQFLVTNQFDWQMATTKSEAARNIARALKISRDGKV